jgi:hypothetical protein
MFAALMIGHHFFEEARLDASHCHHAILHMEETTAWLGW